MIKRHNAGYAPSMCQILHHRPLIVSIIIAVFGVSVKGHRRLLSEGLKMRLTVRRIYRDTWAHENETMLCRILENRHFRRDIDFTVSSFSTAGPLLTALRNQPASFHLLLLDIRLAQENGVELANYLRESDIGCSGRLCG